MFVALFSKWFARPRQAVVEDRKTVPLSVFVTDSDVKSHDPLGSQPMAANESQFSPVSFDADEATLTTSISSYHSVDSTVIIPSPPSPVTPISDNVVSNQQDHKSSIDSSSSRVLPDEIVKECEAIRQQLLDESFGTLTNTTSSSVVRRSSFPATTPKILRSSISNPISLEKCDTDTCIPSSSSSRTDVQSVPSVVDHCSSQREGTSEKQLVDEFFDVSSKESSPLEDESVSCSSAVEIAVVNRQPLSTANSLSCRALAEDAIKECEAIRQEVLKSLEKAPLLTPAPTSIRKKEQVEAVQRNFSSQAFASASVSLSLTVAATPSAKVEEDVDSNCSEDGSRFSDMSSESSSETFASSCSGDVVSDSGSELTDGEDEDDEEYDEESDECEEEASSSKDVSPLKLYDLLFVDFS